MKWHYRDEFVVLEYPKNFTKVEKALHRVLKGPETIKRPLDEVGSMIWELSDGEHNLVQIYISAQESFHERVEPVDKVVGGFLEVLLSLGLMRLDHRPEGKKREGAGPEKERKGKRMIVRGTKNG